MDNDYYNFSIYYGQAREEFLKHENPNLYSQLKLSGGLEKHLIDVDKKACAMEDKLIEQFKVVEEVTEELKKNNQFEWVGRMNNIINRVRKIVQNELVYV